MHPPPLDEVATLGRELARLGFDRHVRQLRIYWLVRAGRVVSAEAWDDAHVLLLLQVLQVPPHETALGTRQRGERCGCTGDGTGALHTTMELADRALMECSACGQRWLVRHPA